jgi:hypothetical protein
VRPWGWTWVDDAPWGFAPFHYGRWVYRRDVWCWVPGTYVARPVYAPALVGWIGGPSVSVSITVGGPPVGWVPLAPREVYVPPYRFSQRYVREVNVTNVTNVTNITTIVNNRNGEADRRDFANRKFPNAVTFVPQEVMLRRQPVAPSAERLRNDPHVRSLVADAAPPPTVTAPPVSAPPPAQRPSSQARPPRPPFENRAAGPAGRPEAPRPPAVGEAQRPGRGNERGGPPPVATTTNPAVAPAPPRVGTAPPAAATPAGPSAGGRGEPSTRPPPPRSEPGTQAQRNASGEARPAYRGREAGDDDRGGPKQTPPPPPPSSRITPPRESAPVTQPAPAIREGSPATRELPPRPSRPPDAVAPSPQGQRPAAANAAPQAAPQAVPQAAVQHPPGEHKMTRPEPPQGKEERRDEKRDGSEKQR